MKQGQASKKSKLSLIQDDKPLSHKFDVLIKSVYLVIALQGGAAAQSGPTAEETARYLISNCYAHPDEISLLNGHLIDICKTGSCACYSIKLDEVNAASLAAEGSFSEGSYGKITGSCSRIQCAWTTNCRSDKTERSSIFRIWMRYGANVDRCLKAIKHLVIVSGGEDKKDPFE